MGIFKEVQDLPVGNVHEDGEMYLVGHHDGKARQFPIDEFFSDNTETGGRTVYYLFSGILYQDDTLSQAVTPSDYLEAFEKDVVYIAHTVDGSVCKSISPSYGFSKNGALCACYYGFSAGANTSSKFTNNVITITEE